MPYAKSLLLFLALAIPAHSQQKPLMVEHGVYQVHLLLHAIGTEEYTITELRGASGDTRRTITSTTKTNDRGTQRTTAAALTYAPHFEPLSFTQESSAGSASETQITGNSAVVKEQDLARTLAKPAVAFVGNGSMPAAVQMTMMRYWIAHHKPARLPILRYSPQTLPLEIKLVGNEAFQIKGQMVRLTRYTVANLVFGREILWMNNSNRVAAIMTFAGGLPQEEVLDEYESATDSIFHSGVRQEMLDLADLGLQAPPEATGTYAIVGARLIDGTGSPALENATVVIKNGRINSVGPWPAPAGIRVIHAEGKTLIPGLWEMHTHYSGVEFGPALLAAGVTTARDCGGEFDFLTTIRNAIVTGKNNVLSPRLLLAGLIDGDNPLAFGSLNADTPAQAIRIVDLYANNHFEQIKVYTQIKPEILKVITDEAHKRGMTVTGHVPAAVNTSQGIEAGMDQINHLQFITRGMRSEGDVGPVDLTSQRAKDLVALLLAKHIVVDPTDGWGEMAGHPKSIDAATFEPGVNAAPYVLSSKFRAMGAPAADEARFRARMADNLKIIKALYDAGIPIVAGSDTGLIGYGLDRELELYVQAGLSPMAALQTATLNAARAMHLEADSGTIQVGKRADLVVLNSNPLDNISNIRRVDKVITEGRLYDSKKLARTVGFTR